MSTLRRSISNHGFASGHVTYPITVEYDDCVGCGEVDAQTSSPRAHEKHQHVRVLIELVNLRRENGAVTKKCFCFFFLSVPLKLV